MFVATKTYFYFVPCAAELILQDAVVHTRGEVGDAHAIVKDVAVRTQHPLLLLVHLEVTVGSEVDVLAVRVAVTVVRALAQNF